MILRDTLHDSLSPAAPQNQDPQCQEIEDLADTDLSGNGQLHGMSNTTINTAPNSSTSAYSLLERMTLSLFAIKKGALSTITMQGWSDVANTIHSDSLFSPPHYMRTLLCIASTSYDTERQEPSQRENRHDSQAVEALKAIPLVLPNECRLFRSLRPKRNHCCRR